MAARNDPNNLLLNYLVNLNPPTYHYARYIDWIIPYLDDIIANALRNVSMH